MDGGIKFRLQILIDNDVLDIALENKTLMSTK